MINSDYTGRFIEGQYWLVEICGAENVNLWPSGLGGCLAAVTSSRVQILVGAEIFK